MPHTLQGKVDEGIMQVLKELETDPALVAASVVPLKIDRRKVYAGDTASDRARGWVNEQRVKPDGRLLPWRNLLIKTKLTASKNKKLTAKKNSQ